ncbi:MAG: DUF4164 domain-containing protein [Devosiaceae bacterium]|nr:DUF4164 domain-containing protein [Devosiaceae bacterium]
MDGINNNDSLEIANKRMERAMERLEKSVEAFSEQGLVLSKLQNDVALLSQQKNEYAIKYNQVAKREKKLDKTASEVSLRLVDAMETIKSVLVK